jgi:hypothetical protein
VDPALTVVVPGRPLSLANARMHWAARMRAVRDRRSLVRLLGQSVRSAGRHPKARVKMRAEAVIWLSGVQFDPDGALSALKPDVDGLVDAGLLRGDKVGDVELGVRQARAKSRREQCVVWTISPILPAEVPQDG